MANDTTMSPFLLDFLGRPYEGVLPSNDTAFQAQCDEMWNEHNIREEQFRVKSATFRGNMALKTAEERMHDKMEQAAREGRLFG